MELAKARAVGTVPGLIKDVFLLEDGGAHGGVLQRFNPDSQSLEAVDWPTPLESWRARTAAHLGAHGVVAGIPPLFLADAVDAVAPALIIPVPFVKRIEGGPGRFAVVPDPAGAQRALIVWLDAERLRHGLLEPLVAKYFAEHEYDAFVPERGWGERVVKRALGSEWLAARWLGGTLAAVCKKSGTPPPPRPFTDFEAFLRCPDCHSALHRDSTDVLRCACGYEAPNEGQVYNLLPAAERKELYPGDRGDIIDFSLPGHEKHLLGDWYDLERARGARAPAGGELFAVRSLRPRPTLGTKCATLRRSGGSTTDRRRR
jgi:hypothetical protein